MSVEAMSAVFDSDVDGSARRFVLLAVANNANARGYCWPGVASIMAVTGLSRATVFRCLTELEAEGLLERRTRRRRNGSQTSNVYRLNLELLRSRTRMVSTAEADEMEAAFADAPAPPSGPDGGPGGRPGARGGAARRGRSGGTRRAADDLLSIIDSDGDSDGGGEPGPTGPTPGTGRHRATDSVSAGRGQGLTVRRGGSHGATGGGLTVRPPEPAVEPPGEPGGAARASRTYASPPPAQLSSGPGACGAPHPDHRPGPEARTQRRSEVRASATTPDPRPVPAETAQEAPSIGAEGEAPAAASEAVSDALSAPSSAAVPRPEPGRPDTWKCDRHLANPDPDDRPCRGCKTVREHCERRDTELRTQAATARAHAARAARAAVKACTWCDDHGDVLNPTTGHCYEPVLRCDHTTTTPQRAAEITARPAPAPAVATTATRAAAIAAFRNRHRPDQTTPTAA